ncbi:MAG: hypothetical protein MUF64_01695 [Polyangiaceae bacterium]|nr:hypothetical protein [Polyangiaceae bacterium]
MSAEPPEPCEEAKSGSYFQFLDDVCKAKRSPGHVDRGQACPVVDATTTEVLPGGKTAVYRPSSEPIEVEGDALKGVIPDEVWMTVILIRRVGGVPHYRYLSNGSHEIAHQPWSTTKFLAAANAASSLRIASDYKVGLTASVKGIPLGDLVTTMHAYDNNPYSSNALGRYFHDIGGRARANDLIHELWLQRPAGETFGGNYGEAAPPLGYSFSEASGATLTVGPDTSAGPANKLSGLTLAEALKRLVLHREDGATRLPGIQWADVETLLHGAAQPEYAATPWGGMSADTAIYLQAGHDPEYIEQRSQGRWRVYSKLGLGSDGTFLDVGYACYPVLDGGQKPVPGWGREFVIAARQQTGGATWRERDRRLARAYRAVIPLILKGTL